MICNNKAIVVSLTLTWFYVIIGLARAGVSESGDNSHEGVLYFSPFLDKRLNSREAASVVPASDLLTTEEASTIPVTSEGFNLLWLVSSRLHQQSRNRHRPISMQNSDISQPYNPEASSVSRRLFRHGISLHSNLPKRVLRHQRISRSNGTVQLKRMLPGKQIGFEMEFRIENTSGSGYIITGRSLGSDGNEVVRLEKSDGRRSNSNRKSDISTSWFGLYSKVSGNQFTLRLEYKNIAWKSKRKFMVPLEHKKFHLGLWHKLTVQIHFEGNTIDYWVNCSHANVINVQHDRAFSEDSFSVYRLLQHRNKAKMPVQVTFRSVVVTDGKISGLPKQCYGLMNVSDLECSGGRVYMNCGPSCEQTCESNHASLHGCSSTCLRGCHCPVGQVYHRGSCISLRRCPCRIGAKRYKPGVNVTINNEICTCINSRWKCYAVSTFTIVPRNQTVVLGSTTNLTCEVSGNPLPRINWILPPGVKAIIEYRFGSRKSQIFLANMTLGYTGVYICQAYREVDGWTSNVTAFIQVTSPPRITSLPSTVTVTLGSPVASVDCGISGVPTPRAAWVKKGSNPWFFTVAPGILRLKITNVNRSDAGEYKCVAMNKAGRAIKSVMILVKMPAPNSMGFKKYPRDRTVKRGSTAVFPCQVIDHGPRTNVTWFKDSEILQFDRRRIIKKKYKLVIKRISKDDAGTYRCLVSSPTNSMHAEAQLMIKGRMLRWSPWSPCSASCGRGWMTKTRNCTGIPPTKKTCHGKFRSIKPCNTHHCPGVCSSYGDPHYTTFDGMMFNFQGDCSYTLAKDADGNDFEITQFNVGCGARLSCVHKLSVVMAFPLVSAVVELARDHTVLINGVTVMLPFLSENGALSIAEIGLYLVLQVKDHLEIRWAVPHRLYVTVAGKYARRTKGLCGNFNGIKADDKLSPSGRPVKSDLEFGQSWAVKDGNANFSCSAVTTLTNPCSRKPGLARQAAGTCLYLHEKKSFGSCHNVVSSGIFVQNCIFDICSTSIEKTDMYFCIALSAYSDECLRHGVVLNWRTTAICPVNCSGGMIYSECGPKCLRFCPSQVVEDGICLSHSKCVAGCFCPEGKVLHNGVCILLTECPCIFNGMVFTEGSHHNRNCQRCECSSGKWKCVFNSLLCDYPALVARGPQSQVVPLSHSVTFCCRVKGIPVPTVEWYHNGKKINIQEANQSSRNGSHDDLNSTLFLDNITVRNEGSYTCKSTNVHGSYISNPATLTIVDPLVTSCNSDPTFNYVHLPEGCYVSENGRRRNVVNLGKCTGKPCYTSTRAGRRVSTCSPVQRCCQPSVTTQKLVRCRHTSYATSFLVTVVQRCACDVCSRRVTVVEGVVKAAGSGRPIKNAMISYEGRTVQYTSNPAGSFRIQLPNLSPETRHVTVTITDVMFKRFATTVKNLLVLPGQSTLHTITMQPSKVRLRFNSSSGLQFTFRRSAGYSHRMTLVIPPNSLMRNTRTKPYRGMVRAVISLTDLEGSGRRRKQKSSLPGSSIGINLNGEEQIVTFSVILSVTLYNVQGHSSLDLLPEKYAMLRVISPGMGMRLQSWSLDDMTGYWRESSDRLEVTSRYTKKGDKIFIATTKIKRLNTPSGIGVSQTPCYLRAKVLNQLNETVPAVRISFSSGDDHTTKESMMNVKANKHRKKSMELSWYVEDLTSSQTNSNGVCLPVGCHAKGMLHASRLGNELVLLEPDTPPSGMGEVKELNSVSKNMTTSTLNADMFKTNSERYRSNLSSHYAYFLSRENCYSTSPSLQTYVFRDETQIEENDVLLRYKSRYHNHVILTFGMPSSHQNAPPPLLKYCHIKVLIRMRPSFAYQGQLQVEVVTFRNRTSSSRAPMTMLGWRHVTLEPLNPGIQKVQTQIACIEYLCGGRRLSSREQLVLHVNIRPKIENNNIQTTDLPKCNFTRFLAPARRAGSQFDKTNNYISVKKEDAFVRGGYVRIPKHTNLSLRYYRSLIRRGYIRDFSARTLTESQKKCHQSPMKEKVSAYFECL